MAQLQSRMHATTNCPQMQENLPELPRQSGPTSVKRCHQCNGRFGLIRRRFAFKQFCSKECVDKYKADSEHKTSRFKRWTDFLGPRQ
jgi:hypothetical protein